MNYKMTLKSVSAKGLPEGMSRVTIILNVDASADIMRDIISEASEMLDQQVDCKIDMLQKKLFVEKK